MFQPLLNETLGKIVSAIGGSMVMFGVAIYMWGAVLFCRER
jgi:hypothetical protein